jgi:hypothetical protein
MENQLRELILPLSNDLIKQLSKTIDNHDKSQINFYWVELAVWMILADFASKLISALVGLLFKRGYEGSFIDCKSCKGRMKFQRYRNRPIITTFGQTSFERAYYYCGTCKRGDAPLDDRLEVGSREFSPRLQRIIAREAAHSSFEVVERNIKESFELSISDEAIREVSQELGQKAKIWEDYQAESYKDKPLASKPTEAKAKTWILEIDGKRVGFQDRNWNEVKVGVIYELGERVETSTGRHKLLKRELIARRSSWQEFVPQFWAAMQRAGIKAGDRLVAIADAAEGIESIFDYVAPEATRVRDFYHVAERVYAIGELRYGVGSEKSKDWISVQLHKLKQSDVSGVIRSIAHLKIERAEEEEKRTKVINYIEKNRLAMDYGSYKSEGLPLGSGAVEGGCKLIGYRTNGCGRRWGYEGCDRIVALRVAVLNDRLDVVLPKPRIEKLAA